MRIAEIFHSIQGEGLLAGVPSIFIRTSGCNLRCHWCDTPYASWKPEGPEMSVEEILKKITEWNCDHVVLTGGEPMIAPDLPKLATVLKKQNKHITIETAGTILPNGIPCDLASLSPKLSNSTPPPERDPAWAKKHESTRLQPEVISEWIRKYPFQLKFVVSSENDLTEIKDLLSRLPPVPLHQILLMPEGIDLKTLATRSPWLVDICKREGFRFCPRLQIELFGHTHGT
ncbi:MAG: 7-carboxy-7-deazaguanine synthase QueE [Candidatus Pacebacteria bacterium]|nr:7-carboxy-7-deazaguanine synthase QueE [Candidatus Paceibacterota bacterium]